MRGDDAFAVLGLRPGAGRAEIDQAYRRLIKRFHPDYANGDAGRAAELNRAYSELRARSREAPRAPTPAGARHPQLYARTPSRRGGPMVGLAAVAVAAILVLSVLITEPRWSWPKLASTGTAALGVEGVRRPSAAAFSLDEPLTTELIETSVGDAMRLHADSDPALAAEFSRKYLSRLGANPSLPLFDSCAAYDEAIAILAVGDPAFESGAFNPSAVTARQVGAARLLSADYFEAESRLQQIRSRVHLILLPGIPDSAPVRQWQIAPVVDVPEIVEIPAVVATVPPRAEPRRTVIHAAQSPAPAPAPARQAAPQRRAPPPLRRAAAQAQPRPQPAAEARQRPAWRKPIKPAWQQPIQPAWQRPIQPESD